MRFNSRLASLWRQVLSRPPELEVLVAIFAFAAAIFTFLKLLSEMREGETHGADQIILLALREPNDPSNPIGPQWLESVCRDLTSLGSPIVLALITIAVICYLWIDGKRAVAAFVVVAIAGAAVLSTLLKLGFARPRPELVSHLVSVDSFSFPSGHATMATVTYLSRVASLERVVGQPQVVRDNLKRMVPVTARIEGRDIGSTVKDVKAVLARQNLIPPQLYYELGGLYKEQQTAFVQLAVVFVAAVSLVFVLLLFLYEEFTIASQVLLVPIVAMSAVFVGLFITGIDLNITALMGLTMVVGIVTEVAIFYFSEFERLKAEGIPIEQALVTAAQNRLRPIAMTTIAAALALLPLALALGQGAEMQQPLAIAIISGLTVQMPLVLLIIPATFIALVRLAGPKR